jgi:hypothetical protein
MHHRPNQVTAVKLRSALEFAGVAILWLMVFWVARTVELF